MSLAAQASNTPQKRPSLSTPGSRRVQAALHKVSLQYMLARVAASDPALGVLRYMGVPEEQVYLGLTKGVAQVEAELRARGTPDDVACLEYILSGKTGDMPRVWSNGVMDHGRPHGLTLDDFAAHTNSRVAGLSRAHVAALNPLARALGVRPLGASHTLADGGAGLALRLQAELGRLALLAFGRHQVLQVARRRRRRRQLGARVPLSRGGLLVRELLGAQRAA